MKQLPLLIAVLVLFTAQAAFADAVITFGSEAGPSKLYLSRNYVKTVTENTEIVFHADKQTLYIVDHDQRSVIPITKAELKQAAEFTEQMMSRYGIPVGGANMPPGMPNEIPEIKREQIGTKTILGCTTKGFRATRDGMLVSEVYVCNNERLMKEFDPNTFRAFEDMIGEYATSLSGGFSADSRDVLSLYLEEGFPYEHTDFTDGAPRTETVTNIEYRSIPKAEFTPPANYERIDFKQVFKSMFSN